MQFNLYDASLANSAIIILNQSFTFLLWRAQRGCITLPWARRLGPILNGKRFREFASRRLINCQTKVDRTASYNYCLCIALISTAPLNDIKVWIRIIIIYLYYIDVRSSANNNNGVTRVHEWGFRRFYRPTSSDLTWGGV